MVEQLAVNQLVVGSNPTLGALCNEKGEVYPRLLCSSGGIAGYAAGQTR